MPPSSSANAPHIIFRIQFESEGRIGRGKMQLLGLIRETGSISAAGRAMDMSYRRAWLLVDEMNRLFRLPVVESQRGGKQGGGAVVTAFGETLLARYMAIEERMHAVFADDLDWIAAQRADAAAEVPPTPAPRS
ncbi:winged helix-turn-helix domain-containing protein [Shinella daejeonensis]|uniref:winged helix-turn-helix domain-containing protein n=1 Tax=Shinella daejeonensis TaxID=659017 RepID=UPI0020C80B57|nr:winged helix-turn-helix domain-containing protein [Shinella daejeonensis]MCP8894762.1 winged helix-turn-helix domain-containing protein [Shinella daejeonensis]